MLHTIGCSDVHCSVWVCVRMVEAHLYKRQYLLGHAVYIECVKYGTKVNLGQVLDVLVKCVRARAAASSTNFQSNASLVCALLKNLMHSLTTRVCTLHVCVHTYRTLWFKIKSLSRGRYAAKWESSLAKSVIARRKAANVWVIWGWGWTMFLTVLTRQCLRAQCMYVQSLWEINKLFFLNTIACYGFAAFD